MCKVNMRHIIDALISQTGTHELGYSLVLLSARIGKKTHIKLYIFMVQAQIKSFLH